MINELISPIRRIQQFSNNAAFFCAVSFMVFIPISTALMNVFIFLTFTFFLLAGNLKNHIIIAWKNPVSKIAFILFFLLIISLNWTIDSSEAMGILKKYNELWYIAFMLPLFDSNRRRSIGINAYLLSMSVVLIGVYLVFFEIILPIEYSVKGHQQSFTLDGGFASHVITNILMSFTMFIAAQKVIFSRLLLKLPYLILFIFSFYYVLFISTGTSGQILALTLIILFIVQHTGVRSVLFIPIIFGLIAVTAIINKSYLSEISQNDSIQFQIEKLQVRYHHMVSTDTAGNNTRPRIYFNTIKLIRHSPWFGSGVGSYEEAFRSRLPESYKLASIAKKNPHNEFLMISVQLGLVGLLLLLYLFYVQGTSSDKLTEKEQKFIAQGLVVLIIIGCMGNSMLLDSREGHFWAFFSALLFSSLNKELQ